MSQETFRKLRQMLMEKLDVCQELTDQAQRPISQRHSPLL